MKCPECNEPMTSSTENYSYAASGLPHVTLVGVEVRRCPACGEHEAVIPKIEQLHKTLSRGVIGKKARLTGAEIRFLRTYLGWSGVDFAKHMGVTAETISRWENGREQMNPVADRLVRLMVVTKSPVADYSLDDLLDLNDHAAPVRLRITAKKGGWNAETAAV
jgi:putative zinc finger/helix-turn-helix YgiT family protein